MRNFVPFLVSVHWKSHVGSFGTIIPQISPQTWLSRRLPFPQQSIGKKINTNYLIYRFESEWSFEILSHCPSTVWNFLDVKWLSIFSGEIYANIGQNWARKPQSYSISKKWIFCNFEAGTSSFSSRRGITQNM